MGVKAYAGLAVAALATAGATPAAKFMPQAGRIALSACRVEGVAAQCGTLRVPENRRTSVGRMLFLRVIVLPSRKPNAKLGPIFYLAGGPGEAATELVSLFADAPERVDMDIVLIDQRGTGGGQSLQCPPPHAANFLKGPFDPPRIAACRKTLSARFDLSQYSTSAWMDDLDQARRALGYSSINLVSGSFGAYAAQRYVQRYGEHVRAAYLLGPVLWTSRVPLQMPQDAQAALNKVLARCHADTACEAAFPAVKSELDGIIANLRARPVQARTPNGQTVDITEAAFVDTLRVLLYRSRTAAEIPYLVHSAASGDFSGFADTALRATRGMYGGVSAGLNLAVTCNEFVNRISDADVKPAVRGSFLGRWRIDTQRAACANWPRTQLGADDGVAFHSDVPALIVTGDADPVVQPRWGVELRRSMPRSMLVIVPGAGHTEEPPCIVRLRSAFLHAGTVRDLDNKCVRSVKMAAFRLR